jgi:NADH dehydrogenase FAD-containing subunit
VVVGAGYTGTEVTAQGVLYTDVLRERHPQLRERPRWLLLDIAKRVLPELDERMSRGYHLLALPGNRARAATDWLLNAVLERQTVQLGLIRAPAVPLEAAAPDRATARA